MYIDIYIYIHMYTHMYMYVYIYIYIILYILNYYMHLYLELCNPSEFSSVRQLRAEGHATVQRRDDVDEVVLLVASNAQHRGKMVGKWWKNWKNDGIILEK